MFLIYIVVLFMIVSVNCDSDDITSNATLEDMDVGGVRRLDSYSDLDLPIKDKYTKVLRAKKSGEANDAGVVADRDEKIGNKRDGKMDNMDAKKEGKKDAVEENPAADTPDPKDTNSRLRNLFDRYKITINDDQPAAVTTSNMTAGNQSDTEWVLSEPEMMEQWSGSGEVMMRAGPGRTQGKHIPSAIELDMAPARGGAVHTLRNKNRLCYRHVMIPEGPKYDSRGKLYLGEFERTKGKNYSQTKPPKLLLPKCCNCCRKSVLGCE